MSKHSLVATGLGLGLMALSMGASAQLHTFDYSSMYLNAVSGGSKYTVFTPTIVRSGVASEGAAGVVMLELFVPTASGAPTWAYAVGGVVGTGAGLGFATNTSSAYQQVSFTEANGASHAYGYFFGETGALSQSFVQAVALGSGAVCNVTFSAVLGTDDALRFNNVSVQPSGFSSAAGIVHYRINSLTAVAATNVSTLASSAWNNASVTLPTGFGSVIYSSTDQLGATTLAGTGAFAARNNCVPSYTARSAPIATTLSGAVLGAVRVF